MQSHYYITYWQYCFRCTINPHQARDGGGEAVSRDILLYISFIVCWVGLLSLFLKTSFYEPLFFLLFPQISHVQLYVTFIFYSDFSSFYFLKHPVLYNSPVPIVRLYISGKLQTLIDFSSYANDNMKLHPLSQNSFMTG